jgi:hypothetical protein
VALRKQGRVPKVEISTGNLKDGLASLKSVRGKNFFLSRGSSMPIECIFSEQWYSFPRLEC